MLRDEIDEDRSNVAGEAQGLEERSDEEAEMTLSAVLLGCRAVRLSQLSTCGPRDRRVPCSFMATQSLILGDSALAAHHSDRVRMGHSIEPRESVGEVGARGCGLCSGVRSMGRIYACR